MKYRLLLAGKNNELIDEIFTLSNSFETITTSMRLEDILLHVQICKPDAFVFCCYMDSVDVIAHINAIKQHMVKENVPFILIGTQGECETFQQVVSSETDLMIKRPMEIAGIEAEILKFLDDRKKEQEEARRMREEIEALKQQGNTGKKHILIVDDDPLMLKALKERLHNDYEIATAISGRVAFRFLEKKKTDLILLDYEMPGEDGAQVMERLRSTPETADIPVVFLTGISDSQRIKKVLVMKPQGYLLKPIDNKKLMSTLQEILG